VDFGVVLRVSSLLLIVEAAAMIPSLGIAAYYGEGDLTAFLISIAVTLAAGLMGYWHTGRRGFVRYREGFMIVGVGWLLASAFGMLPFLLYGTFDSVIDAFFEAVSGFTTTGATVLQDIESQPHGILFWRAMTHWLGGMGILVLALAILPAVGLGTFQIFKSESPGPTPGKLVPRVGRTAQILYTIYVVLTLLQVIALRFAGMNWFDAVTHSFATMGTGGFSTKNASIGGFANPAAEWVISLFMLLASINFSLYYELLTGKAKPLVRDGELRLFITIVVISILFVTVNIRGLYESMGEALQDAVFHVLSIASTSGFVAADYHRWPEFSRTIIFFLTFLGACAGSTGGGVKHIRLLIVLKYVRRTLYRLIHPQAVIPLRVNGRSVSEEVVQNVSGFLMVYGLLFVSFTLILLTQNMDLISSSSAVATALSNVGPGFGVVGPNTNFASLTDLSKLLLSAAMILGRLEIFTILVLLVPAFWRR
jgi:trk system potassium uptake protein TrkH